MLTLKQIIFVSVLVFALLTTAAAQDNTTAQRSSLTITAAAAGERVRITAPSSVVQMHVEVYAAGGEKLFDQEIRGGNVFDWHLQDGQAQRLAPGNYVCVVTAKSISGKLTQKIGTVNVEEKSASVQPADSPQLSVQQTQAIGPVEENSSWTVAAKDEPQTGTVIANDGTDGQMIRGRGALTFRIGNFFSGIDKEQMRLSEDGRLGIGTSTPQSTLDVAGTIRAERFLVVKPAKPGAANQMLSGDMTRATDAADPGQLLISGSGTLNHIAKWTPDGSTVGDSGIFETVGGLVGIGTTAPDSKLVVSSNSATLPAASSIARFADADGIQTAVFADAFGTNPIFNVRRANGTAAAPSALLANQLLGVIGASGYGTSTYVGTRARVGFWASENWTNTANGTYFTFNTTANGAATPGGSERMRIDNAGNVGIGTTGNPAARLHVAGGDVLFENKWRTETTTYTPNLIGGFLGTGSGGATPGNRVTPGVVGATIGGGGFNGSITLPCCGTFTGDFGNRVTDWFGIVGGGLQNRAGNDDATLDNAKFATVGGGNSNTASGEMSTVGGGDGNTASGDYAATVGGGAHNTASGELSTVPGGIANTAFGDYSFAAGRRAKANHTGTFVWADSTDADFASTGDNQFLIRASGGVGIGTDSPKAKLQVTSGDVYVQTQGNGIILRATDGTNCFRVTVNNTGTLAATVLLTCP